MPTDRDAPFTRSDARSASRAGVRWVRRVDDVSRQTSTVCGVVVSDDELSSNRCLAVLGVFFGGVGIGVYLGQLIGGGAC